MRRDMNLEALKRTLATPREPQIMRRPADFLDLRRMCLQGQSKSVRKILERRAKAEVTVQMRALGVSRGAPRTAKHLVYLYAALLKNQHSDYSWNKLARLVDPEGYRRDPRRATDRTRMGVAAALKDMTTAE